MAELRGVQDGAPVCQARAREKALDYALSRFGGEPAEFTSTTTVICAISLCNTPGSAGNHVLKLGFGLSPPR